MGFIRPSRELAPAEERRGGERAADTSAGALALCAWPLRSRCLLAACTAPDDGLKTALRHRLKQCCKVLVSWHFTTKMSFKHLCNIMWSVWICTQSGTDRHLRGGVGPKWSLGSNVASKHTSVISAPLLYSKITTALNSNVILRLTGTASHLNTQTLTHAQNRTC